MAMHRLFIHFSPPALGPRLVALAMISGLACVGGEPPGVSVARAGASPAVILISMDGTRPADVTRESIPSLVALAERGLVAERLIPATPSDTFPSHVTLATGVEPEQHGVVGNAFRDSELGLFRKSDAHDFIDVEPIWSYLAAHGLESASYHWPGSEGVWRSGRGPRYRMRFADPATEGEKVAQILQWLDLPEKDGRPHLITAWFRGGDGAGHEYGPGSPEVGRLLASQEGALAALVAGLEERGLFEMTTVIVVSDHGMVAAEHEVDLRHALSEAGIDAEVFGAGGSASILLSHSARRASDAVDRIIAVARGLGLYAVRRTEAPAEMRVANARFGDVVVRAQVGTAIVYADRGIAGYHGYESSMLEMGGIFIASGRGVEPGIRIPPVRAVDVTPTVLRLLGLGPAEWMEGTAIPLILP
jgi:hypothetical protein